MEQESFDLKAVYTKAVEVAKKVNMFLNQRVIELSETDRLAIKRCMDGRTIIVSKSETTPGIAYPGGSLGMAYLAVISLAAVKAKKQENTNIDVRSLLNTISEKTGIKMYRHSDEHAGHAHEGEDSRTISCGCGALNTLQNPINLGKLLSSVSHLKHIAIEKGMVDSLTKQFNQLMQVDEHQHGIHLQLQNEILHGSHRERSLILVMTENTTINQLHYEEGKEVQDFVVDYAASRKPLNLMIEAISSSEEEANELQDIIASVENAFFNTAAVLLGLDKINLPVIAVTSEEDGKFIASPYGYAANGSLINQFPESIKEAIDAA